MQLKCSMLYVKDFSKMKDFYIKMLRANPVNTDWNESWALFETGFALHAIPNGHGGKVDLSAASEAREESPVKLIFLVEDVEAERNRLEGMGITMLRRTWQQPAESCDGMDPEGNVFQIVAARHWPHVSGTSGIRGDR